MSSGASVEAFKACATYKGRTFEEFFHQYVVEAKRSGEPFANTIWKIVTMIGLVKSEPSLCTYGLLEEVKLAHDEFKQRERRACDLKIQPEVIQEALSGGPPMLVDIKGQLESVERLELRSLPAPELASKAKVAFGVLYLQILRSLGRLGDIDTASGTVFDDMLLEFSKLETDNPYVDFPVTTSPYKSQFEGSEHVLRLSVDRQVSDTLVRIKRRAVEKPQAMQTDANVGDTSHTDKLDEGNARRRSSEPRAAIDWSEAPAFKEARASLGTQAAPLPTRRV